MSKEKQKHTPGPWTHDEAQDFRICVFTEGPEDPICDVRCHDGSSSGEHGEANARIIAVAPEMLAQLRGWLAIFTASGAAHVSPLVAAAMEETAAIVRKAEGK